MIDRLEKNFLAVFFMLTALTGLSSARAGAAPAPFTFEHVVELIGHHDVRSVDELLPLLPGPLHSDFVIVYRSRNKLQEGTVEAPRILMFSKDATFMATFNGDPKKRGYNDLEIMQYRPETRRFEFRDIHFGVGQKPGVSEANPRICLKCHQSTLRGDVDPRPNWEPHSWMGIYGGVNYNFDLPPGDSVEPYIAAVKNDFIRFFGDDVTFEQSRDENKTLAGFFEKQPASPRYKSLVNPRNANQVKIDVLTKALLELNLRRVARLVTAAPYYQNYRYALLGMNKCVDNDPSATDAGIHFLPPEIAKAHDAIAGAVYHPEYIGTPGMEKIFDYLFTPMGVNIEDWTTEFRSATRVTNGEPFGGGFDNRFLGELVALDSRLAGFFKARLGCIPDFETNQCGGRWMDGTVWIPLCTALKKQSSEELSRIHPAFIRPVYQRDRGRAPAILQKCISCHTGEQRVAPPIDFDQPQKLSAELAGPARTHARLLIDEIEFRTREDAIPAVQMPPGGMKSREARDLLDYFNYLLKFR